MYMVFHDSFYSTGETVTIQRIAIPTCSGSTGACSGKTFTKYTTGTNCSGVTVVDSTGKIIVPSNYFTSNSEIHACWQ